MSEPSPSSTDRGAGVRLSRAARHTGLLNLVGGGFSALATLGLTVLLARALPPDEAGRFFSATSLFLLLSVLGQLGTPTGLVYFLAREPGAGHDLLRIAARPVGVVAVASGLVLVGLAGPVARVTGLGTQGQSALVVAALGVGLPVAAALSLWISACLALADMRAAVLADQVVRPILQVVLCAVVVGLDGGAGWLVIAWLVPYLPAAALAAGFWRRAARSLPPHSATTPTSSDFWRFTAPRGLAGIAQQAMQRLDIVLVGALADLRAAAIYTAATRFLVLGQLVGMALTRTVQPALARALGRRETAVARRIYRDGTAGQVVLSWPVYLVLVVAAGPVLGIFGGTYVDGAPVVVLLSLTMLVATGCGVVDVVLTMTGRSGWSLMNSLLALTLNVVLDFVLIPPFGITGAAVAWAVAILANNLVPLAQVRATTGLHPFGRATLGAMALSAGCFGVLPGLARLLTPGSLPILVVAIGIGGVVWLLTLWRAHARLGLAGVISRLA